MIIKKLFKEYKKENVIDELKNISSYNIIDDINDIIDDIKYEFENINEFHIVEFDDDEIIDEFDIINELTNVINEFDIDDIIELINEFDDHYDIYVNDESTFDLFNLTLNNFNYYNSNNTLIIYKRYIDKFNTINYYDVDEYYDIDDIVDEIINNL